MLDVDYLKDEVLASILQNKGLPDDEESYAIIGKLTVHEAFDAYLNWHGIIGYTTLLMEALDSIQQSNLSHLINSAD